MAARQASASGRESTGAPTRANEKYRSLSPPQLLLLGESSVKNDENRKTRDSIRTADVRKIGGGIVEPVPPSSIVEPGLKGNASPLENRGTSGIFGSLTMA